MRPRPSRGGGCLLPEASLTAGLGKSSMIHPNARDLLGGRIHIPSHLVVVVKCLICLAFKLCTAFERTYFVLKVTE